MPEVGKAKVYCHKCRKYTLGNLESDFKCKKCGAKLCGHNAQSETCVEFFCLFCKKDVVFERFQEDLLQCECGAKYSMTTQGPMNFEIECVTIPKKHLGKHKCPECKKGKFTVYKNSIRVNCSNKSCGWYFQLSPPPPQRTTFNGNW